MRLIRKNGPFFMLIKLSSSTILVFNLLFLGKSLLILSNIINTFASSLEDFKRKHYRPIMVKFLLPLCISISKC